MVASPFRLAAVLSAAAVAVTDAASIAASATTPLPVVSVLNKDHPAFGGMPSPNMVRPIAPPQEVISRAEIAANPGTAAPNTTAPLTSAPSPSPTWTPEPTSPSPTAVNSTEHTRRKLEATSADVQRLESHFGQWMERNIYTLQQRWSGTTPQPIAWPGGYWPNYLDSINYRWSGEASPAEKYARAFGRDPGDFMNQVSAKLGVDSLNWLPSCTGDWQCSGGDICAKREGQSSGHCMQTWYGICHAWAPASIQEPEPRCAVNKNGIQFYVQDLKALMTAMYAGAGVPVVFTGARYDGGNDGVDEYGRYIDAAHRDLGPGFFHIATTNIMGRFGKSFIVDVSPGPEVWNQPVRGYQVREVSYMSIDQAAQQFFNVARYPFNNEARKAAYVHMTFSWITESLEDGPLVSTGKVDSATHTQEYYYLLELDDNDNIIGGEWLWDSQRYHPDFLWFTTANPSNDATTAFGLKYSDVAELFRAAVSCGGPDPNPGTCGNDQTGATSCPNGQYCQPWNPSFYQCRSIDAKCGQQETGVDFYGDDISTHQLNLPEECCAKCHETQGCKAYTFINYNADGKAYCYLKKGSGQRQYKTGAVSAVIQSGGDSCAPRGGSCGNQWSGPQCCQNGQYCQPWNPDQYQCRDVPSQCGIQEVNVDYYGDDISTHQLVLPEECCDKCASTPGCKAYTFINYNADGKAYCYLKKGTGQKSTKVGAVSGVVTNPRPDPSCSTPLWGGCGNAATGASCCPDNQYCQPWDAGNFQCIYTPSKCSRQQTNVDFYGDDLAQFFGIGPGECCDKCAETDGCRAYTYVNDNKPQPACYLKRGTGEQRYHPSAVSAQLN
ncbi:hypothetical protein ATCC90586_007983 [Pythium insidiosum]|nr:hypothetical protein ATCC90586_007983 [Pythium insidiosum]